MPSFQITLTPSKRAAGRFVSRVRRAIQRALAEEEKKRGITQSDLARAIGVNRSVINREIRGHKDMTIGRVAELAWALGRKPIFDLPEITIQSESNIPPQRELVLPVANTVSQIVASASTTVPIEQIVSATSGIRSTPTTTNP
jgi:transcriptional regulator with XRE-family HTH domain